MLDKAVFHIFPFSKWIKRGYFIIFPLKQSKKAMEFSYAKVLVVVLTLKKIPGLAGKLNFGLFCNPKAHGAE